MHNLCKDCHLLFEELISAATKITSFRHSETQCHEKHFEGSLNKEIRDVTFLKRTYRCRNTSLE